VRALVVARWLLNTSAKGETELKKAAKHDYNKELRDGEGAKRDRIHAMSRDNMLQ
jgi:hypothetical protein